MFHTKRNVNFLILLFMVLCFCGQAQAKPKYVFKVASIAPEGSIWTKRFHDFAAEVTTSTLNALKKSKVWAPENDPVSATYFNTLGITPLPLTIPDVLTSLQTGMVETVFNSLYGNIVLQWFTKTKYISDIPFGYTYGVMLLDRKKFTRLPEAYQSMIKETAKKHFDLLITDTRKSNQESRQVLQDNGVSFVPPNPEDVTVLNSKHEETMQLLQGTAFSRETYQATTKLLNEYRNRQDKK